MIHANLKLFPKDKNYILKEVQTNFKAPLLTFSVKLIIQRYLELHNPLGIKDATVEAIENYQIDDLQNLDEFYYDLAAMYRYHNCENQLELIFEGHTQFDKYASEWEYTFNKWIESFCDYPHFLKAILGLTVFDPGPEGAALIGHRLKVFLNKHFNLKVYKYRGVRQFNVA